MFTKNQVVVAALSVLSSSVFALPADSQIFRAENGSPSGTVTPDVLAARAAFLSTLDSTAQSFGFERPVNVGTGPTLNVSFTGSAGAISASLVGNAGQQVVGTSSAGRFNTTSGGSQYWQVDSSANGAFSITFGRSISAFGFYGTDIGDFGGVLSLVLTPWNGGPDETLVVRPQSVNNANSGGLLFFGFSDVNSEYRRVTFLSSGTGTSVDYFGFDDFVVADKGQIRTPTTPPGVPEPGSLALVGLALCAAGIARRARKAA